MTKTSVGNPCNQYFNILIRKRFGSHGPYDVKGDLEVSGRIRHQPESPVKMTLCRCGHSINKPYCSGEHYKIKFQDDKNEYYF
ncbi:MAG: CDGSH iron-sulfur domain-containing protein [Clostridiales bacterium]|nr:CDGSH iron-sulfur domain-containing protein [Clostridiales bacterium]